MKNFKDAVWKENVTKVIKQIQEQDIKFVRLQFTDINGMLKNLAVNSKNIESIFENGQSFDGSSITGYRAIEESDMVLYPDPTTFAVLPWRAKEKSSCRLICDVYTPQNKRFEADPRYILERAVEKASKAGVTFICAPELEFFIVKEAENGGLPTPIDLAGYFDFHPSDLTDDLRREIADTAEAFGIEIEISHHEVALGQNEIDFKYGSTRNSRPCNHYENVRKSCRRKSRILNNLHAKTIPRYKRKRYARAHEPLEQRQHTEPVLCRRRKEWLPLRPCTPLHRWTTRPWTKNVRGPQQLAKQLQTISPRIRSTSLPCMGT